jgi:FtsH-binding integral membrane protein
LYGRALMAEESTVVIEHPNRDKAASKATKAVVLLLLLVSAALMTIVAVGGWDELQGTKAVLVGYILVYLIMAYYVGQWNRGVLPVAAALAIIMAIFAAVAVPGWLDRDADGFAKSTIDADVLGLICAIIIPVQVLLIAFAMRGFNQAWNVEVERTVEHRGPGPGAAPQAA